jgi:uncharacterized protein Veg
MISFLAVLFCLFISMRRRLGLEQTGHTLTMIKPTKNIKDIKQMVKDCSLQRVAVKVNLGRNKSVSYSGVLSGIYPALFTVKPDDEEFLGKTAYSYSDVLCGNVKIKRL